MRGVNIVGLNSAPATRAEVVAYVVAGHVMLYFFHRYVTMPVAYSSLAAVIPEPKPHSTHYQ